MNKHVFSAIILAFCYGCSHPPVVPVGDAEMLSHIPIDGTPTISLWYGSKELTMGVDTGAMQDVVLFSPAVESLGGRLRGKGAMRTTRMDIRLLPDSPEPITDSPDVSVVKYAPYEGLIGWDLIRRYVWNLNVPDDKHNFYKKLPERVKHWKSFKLIPTSDYAQIADPAGRTILIDTGAPYALYISKRRWTQFKHDYPDAFVSMYNGYSPAAGGHFAKECMRIKSYTIGKLTLTNVIVCESFIDESILQTSSPIDIILGMGAFMNREFWFDGPGNTVYFSSFRKPSPFYMPFNHAGVTFIPDNNPKNAKDTKRQDPAAQTLIAKVAPWSPAWEAGLRSGDELISINGREHPNFAVIDYVTTQVGAEAVVVVKRGKNIITTQWTVRQSAPPAEFYRTPAALPPDTTTTPETAPAEPNPAAPEAPNHGSPSDGTATPAAGQPDPSAASTAQPIPAQPAAPASEPVTTPTAAQALPSVPAHPTPPIHGS